MDNLYLLIMFTCILAPALKVSMAVDFIQVSQSISDGSETLVSKGGKFELGFFSPANSTKRYLGIWYKNIPIQTVVWVANRVNPINDSSGILTLDSTGKLVLTQNDSLIWNATSQRPEQNPVAELLDSGNLVVRNEEEANPEEYLWQSFDYPTDTLLPGMKVGWDFRNGLERSLTPWKSEDDPSPGDISTSLVLNNYPEYYLMNGAQKFSRLGPWNGLDFSGMPLLQTSAILFTRFVSKNNFKYVPNKDEFFFTYSIKNKSLTFRAVLNQTSPTHHGFVWNEGAQTWEKISTYPRHKCDYYGLCGANGNCMSSESPICQCLPGFTPKSPQAWNSSNWSQGCVRDKPLSCNDKHNHRFVKLKGSKVPDTTHTWLDETINLDECRVRCLNNCSCVAYANSDIRGGGSGCVMWFGNLIDIVQIQASKQDLYIRMPASELEPQNGHNKNTATIIATTVAAICGMLLLCIYFICKAPRNIAENSKDYIKRHLDDLDLTLFDLPIITTATSNFYIKNKIGEGGFGPVYRGKLADGQEIAVKRLSNSSGQGMTEFITEVKLIAKLQHRNLVKLLGYCNQGQEKLLVYEYMTNGSLDSFIFDNTKGKLLEWPQRLCIIFGIARGVLYLHQDSRLRIIHRDLKASNILLDDKLNPKISDFGIAKTFGAEQIEGNTNKVVGTYGYMAPEYAINGLFSIKSDVFSFGILMLEIISGNKNRALCHANETLNLVGYAWTLWNEGKALQLIVSNIDSCVVSEVLRCIHVSLLCVQQYPKDRPTMTSVVQMLGSEMELLKPKEPGFFLRKVSSEASLFSDQNEMNSNNELTITQLSGR